MGGQEMTLDEAIKHCKEVAESCSGSGCALDHRQLAAWLEELKRFKQPINYDVLYDKSHEAFNHSAFDIHNGWDEAVYCTGYKEGYCEALGEALQVEIIMS